MELIENIFVDAYPTEGHDAGCTHQVSETDEGTVRIREEADDHVAVQDRHGRLVPVQDAFLDRASWSWTKHGQLMLVVCLYVN